MRHRCNNNFDSDSETDNILDATNVLDFDQLLNPFGLNKAKEGDYTSDFSRNLEKMYLKLVREFGPRSYNCTSSCAAASGDCNSDTMTSESDSSTSSTVTSEQPGVFRDPESVRDPDAKPPP